ncbi:MAG: ATP-dependent Clp protease adaptor ClpS [Planctomycetes bacterium]|nr:ATP-dependent Clp protease adaptor ClpS [Planctomycetota bacterium]
MTEFRSKSESRLEVEQESQQGTQQERRPALRKVPRYKVILWDDNDHSFDYVIGMMRVLFGHPSVKGRQIADEVDSTGRAICLTTTLEHAELKRDQILSYGGDPRASSSGRSMKASIEPVE